MAEETTANPPYFGYQAYVGGKLIRVENMTMEEAKIALADAMDALEVADEQVRALLSGIDLWRSKR